MTRRRSYDPSPAIFRVATSVTSNSEQTFALYDRAIIEACDLSVKSGEYYVLEYDPDSSRTPPVVRGRATGGKFHRICEKCKAVSSWGCVKCAGAGFIIAGWR